MKLTIQDVDSVLVQNIELARDTAKKKKLLYCPLTGYYTILKDGDSIWPEGNKSKHESIVRYNQI